MAEDMELNLDTLSDEVLWDIYEAVKDGATTVGEVAGFDPPALNAIEQMALGYYRAKLYGQAAPIFGFLLQMEPTRSSAWRGLGAICHAVKNYSLAVRCYQLAVHNNLDDIPSRVFWGECLCALGQKDEGLAQLRHTIEAGTENAAFKPYITRARAVIAADGGVPPRIVLTEQGRNLAKEAEEALAAQGFLPDSEGPQYDPDREITAQDMLKNPELAGVLGDLKKAIEDGTLTYKDLGGFTDNEMEGAYACACKYAEMGQVLEAIQITGYLMFLDPYEARYYQLVAICLQRMKQYEIADHYYSMALAMDKENPMSLVYRGESKIMSGSVDEGVAFVKQGVEAATGNPAFKDIIDRGNVLIRQFGR